MLILETYRRRGENIVWVMLSERTFYYHEDERRIYKGGSDTNLFDIWIRDSFITREVRTNANGYNISI